MLFFSKINYFKLKKINQNKLNPGKKLIRKFMGSNFDEIKNFNWAVHKFFISKVNYTISPKLKDHYRFKRYNLKRDELFSLKLIINNFCSNGKFIKYYNMFSEILFNIKSQVLLGRNNDNLSARGLDNLIFVLKLFKNNLLINIKSHFLYRLFSKYELLFFAKAIKLNKRVAKKKKKKYLLGFDYIKPRRRFPKLVKFWKYYLNYVSKAVFKRKLFKGIFQLIVNYKKSILVKYRKKTIKLLIKNKKMKF